MFGDSLLLRVRSNVWSSSLGARYKLARMVLVVVSQRFYAHLFECGFTGLCVGLMHPMCYSQSDCRLILLCWYWLYKCNQELYVFVLPSRMIGDKNQRLVISRDVNTGMGIV
jgi:hypothetical protein